MLCLVKKRQLQLPHIMSSYSHIGLAFLFHIKEKVASLIHMNIALALSVIVDFHIGTFFKLFGWSFFSYAYSRWEPFHRPALIFRLRTIMCTYEDSNQIQPLLDPWIVYGFVPYFYIKKSAHWHNSMIFSVCVYDFIYHRYEYNNVYGLVSIPERKYTTNRWLWWRGEYNVKVK